MCVFFFNDTATTEIYTLSLHDALPILVPFSRKLGDQVNGYRIGWYLAERFGGGFDHPAGFVEVRPEMLDLRSEEHTSELQSRQYLVCRLLLEKKNHTPPLAPALLHRTP